MSEDVHVIWVSRQPTVAVRFTCAPEEVSAKLAPALSEVGEYRFKPGRVCKMLIDAYSAEVMPKRVAAE